MTTPSRCRALLLGALQVGDQTAAGLDQLVRLDAEHVVPCARRRPHLRVLQQIGIDEHAQLGGMTKRGHATVGLGNPKGGPPFRTTHPEGGKHQRVTSRSDRLQWW